MRLKILFRTMCFLYTYIDIITNYLTTFVYFEIERKTYLLTMQLSINKHEQSKNNNKIITFLTQTYCYFNTYCIISYKIKILKQLKSLNGWPPLSVVAMLFKYFPKFVKC